MRYVLSKSKIHWRWRLLFRAVALVLIPAQVLLSIPVSAIAGQQAPRKESPLPAPKVKVNRVAPKVRARSAYPTFSDSPTDREIFRARVFGEALVPAGGTVWEEENRALAQALTEFLHRKDPEDFSSLESFLAEYPTSRWRGSLLMNLGMVYRRSSYFGRAEKALAEAWEALKSETEPPVRATADRALAELLDLHMQFGRVEPLEALLSQIEEREMRGGAADRVYEARTTAWGLRNQHQNAIPSGRVALERLLAIERPGVSGESELGKLHATVEGATLREVERFAARVGLKTQMAYRGPGAEVVTPAVMHLRAGHFTTVVEKRGEKYRLADPLLGGEVWMSARALEEEASGFFLIREGDLPAGWRRLEAKEVESVRGKCKWPVPVPEETGQCDDQQGGCSGAGASPGMAGYSFHTLLASLHITDTPVGYTPPRGPAVQFQVTYNQREYYQPQVFYYSNLGARWTFDWLSYMEDNPSTTGEPVHVYLRGGGRETYEEFSEAGSAPHVKSRAVVVRKSPVRYERHLADGSVEVFSLPDGAMTSPRRIFMTSLRDPQGNALEFTYDEELRLVAVTDAIGQVTTLSYELESDPLKITRVTDPFGRSATLGYSGAGELVRITDVLGMSSELEYGTQDFIRSLTTPYGTTTFRTGVGPNFYTDRYVEATDPMGGTERVLYLGGTDAIPNAEPESGVPVGFADANWGLEGFNSVYWDKRAMALYPGDVTKAHVSKWLFSGTYKVSGTKHSEKLPLEGRVWYGHMGAWATNGVGPDGRPAKVGRVLDDGSSQIYRYEWNSKGLPTRFTDPLGRETLLDYDTNQIDLLRVRQKNGAGYDLLGSATYKSQHLPLTVKDAAGQTTTLTYNDFGQVRTLTNAKNETTTFEYEEGTGYLQRITGPVTGAIVELGWDGYGRVRTVTYENRTVTLDYDLMDRPIRVTYPDGTFEEVEYNRLDGERFRDRLGRWSQVVYDALRRVVSVRDPLGRMVTQQWCNCGGLEKLIDVAGNATSWQSDLQGRVTKEIRADESFAEVSYETRTSRVKEVKDPNGQLTKYEYFVDDSLKRARLTNADDENFVPSVSLAYDASYLRPVTKNDGTGTTRYGYHPIMATPTLGAGQLASIDGPLVNDTMTYSYDELGRLTSTSVAGIPSSQEFDPLGRVKSQTNALGTFTYVYEGMTERLSSIMYPNGQATSLSYFGKEGDDRLREILHKKPGGSLLSRHAYTYLPNGNIKTWTQETDTNGAKVYEFGYDAADQLTSAVLKKADPTPTILKRYAYSYDKAGNRTTEQIDDVATQAVHNNLNQLKALQPGGALKFAGTVSESASVTIQGKPATVTAENRFEGAAQVGPGTNAVEVRATDASGNVGTATYEVNVAGSSKTLQYDANGNLTSDGTRTYEWDALDQLVAINQGSQRTEFTYDGEGRRVRIVEKENGAAIEDRYFLWCGDEICEERDSGGNTVKRYLSGGLQQGGGNYFLAGDHLGSAREMTDSTGFLRARYDYSPFGTRTKTAGDLDADFGYTGHLAHAGSGLALAMYRAYDSGTGRWLSPDPIGLSGGMNLYSYVENDPVNGFDPLGLCPSWSWGEVAAYFALGLVVGAVVALAFAAVLATLPAWALAPAMYAGMGYGGYSIVRTIFGFVRQAKAGTLCANQVAFFVGSVIGGAIAGWRFPLLKSPTNAQVQGPLVRWGTSSREAAKTAQVARGLNRANVLARAVSGLRKQWVQKQWQKYTESREQGGPKLNNVQLVPRLRMMENLMKYWPPSWAPPFVGGVMGGGVGGEASGYAR